MTFHFDKIHSAPAIRFSKPNAISLHSYTTNMVNYDNIINLFIHDHTLFCDECEDRRQKKKKKVDRQIDGVTYIVSAAPGRLCCNVKGLSCLNSFWRVFLFFLGFELFWNYSKVVRVFLEVNKRKQEWESYRLVPPSRSDTQF